MDLVLHYADEWLLNDVYQQVPFKQLHNVNNWTRESISLFLIVMFYAVLMYFGFAGLSYQFLYDKRQMKHPRFLKDQITKEIKTSLYAFPFITLMTLPWFLGEVRGHSKLYSDVSEYGWPYLIFSMFWFLFFTDGCIYWIHRWLHHPLLYSKIHKPHHKWIVPTPFASHAFHPLDGYLQSVPYHIFVYLFPMHKLLYLGMFLFVNIWTISIHDGVYFTKNNPLINGSAHHTLHHLYFNYNYGQYFTLWDRIGGSFRKPQEFMFENQNRFNQERIQKELKAVDQVMDQVGDLKDSSKEFIKEE